MKRPAYLRLLCALVCASSGCSLIVSTSGLSDGPTRSEADGGISGEAAITDSQGTDTGASDSMPQDGGNGDAVADAPSGDGGSSPCAEPHLFCDDFERDTTSVRGAWNRSIEQTGSLSLSSVTSVSPALSLLVDLKSTTGTRTSSLAKDLSIAAGSMTIDLDLNFPFPATASFGEIDPMELKLYPPPSTRTSHGIAIVRLPTSYRLEYFREKPTGGYETTSKEIPPTGASWQHFTFQLKPSPARVACSVDGTEIVTFSLEPTPTATSSATLSVGAVTNNATTTGPIYLDNIVVDSP